MINLTRKMKKEDGGNHTKRAFIRDKLLLREVQEMEQNLPKGMACIFTLFQLLTLSLLGCLVKFPDHNILHEFDLTIQPDEGHWKHGKFRFTVSVPEEYNMTVRDPSVDHFGTCNDSFWSLHTAP